MPLQTPSQKQFASDLRLNATDAERKLWRHLRLKQIGGRRFRRQFSLGPFIVDFVCLPARLVVEIDGGQHADNEADERRTRWLESQGFTVLRFWNTDALTNTEGVIDTIQEAVAQRLRELGR